MFPFKVEFEFSLMHKDKGTKFIDKWPIIAPKLISHSQQVSSSPALKKFLTETGNKSQLNKFKNEIMYNFQINLIKLRSLNR